MMHGGGLNAPRLLDYHDCKNNYWNLVQGRHSCEHCGHAKHDLIYECCSCHVRACCDCKNGRNVRPRLEDDVHSQNEDEGEGKGKDSEDTHAEDESKLSENTHAEDKGTVCYLHEECNHYNYNTLRLEQSQRRYFPCDGCGNRKLACIFECQDCRYRACAQCYLKTPLPFLQASRTVRVCHLDSHDWKLAAERYQKVVWGPFYCRTCRKRTYRLVFECRSCRKHYRLCGICLE
ncbi:uncharacterized protein K452DRAFT_142949 [Aplosporella prunicola CBS 121167]|uniref:Uncharacterized protein n=1 Tax=Aplosporella prunicola CBS 121167 TaxID=1176127 RepID=A0A6A6BK35_9PEZI|nr:uncharacterized protein K452DRAFT_142949 [Aplosporella prunicola CBS 121167]KAF2144500.1 hypothetical protein K452DRAFT_142949 [Aplosporella prunicola CBS 121167]